MPLNSGFQLSVELTNVFGGAAAAVSAVKDLISFSRELKKSGSDIVVEEDLADIFGRGRVVPDLKAKFKEVILARTGITPIHGDCVIQLQYGPGPTVNRAFTDQGGRYLSTVIQLSCLAWMHDRTELSSALIECMRKRLEMNIPGANSDPGFDGVFNTLEACSSQTSAFAWNDFARQVRSTIERAYPPFKYQGLYILNRIERLSPNILLAAMDYLYLVQSLPEDRKMILQSQEGMIPLIVWAHNILGLTVRVHQKAERGIIFGTGAPQVTIQFDLGVNPEESTEILLLDQDINVVLKCGPSDNTITKIRSQERHLLRGYGSEHLRRKFNEYFVTEIDDPVYKDTIQFILAFIILRSSTLRLCTPGYGETLKSHPCSCKLEQWRIYDAGDVIFYGLEYDRSEVQSYVNQKGLSALTEANFPSSIEQYLAKLLKTNDMNQTADQDGILASNRRMLEYFITSLATFILIFAHVLEVKECNELPLVFDIEGISKRPDIHYQLLDCKPIFLAESDIFYYISGLMIGSNLTPTHYNDCFLVSDFGWSTFLSSCGDSIPAKVRPELLHIRRGVPTNGKTGERKLRIADAPTRIASLPPVSVLDRQGEYVPRCAIRVNSRTEYYASRSREFLLSIRFELDHQFSLDSLNTEVYTSYRNLHRSLWSVESSNTYKRFMHSQHLLAKAKLGTKLGIDVATVQGYGWEAEAYSQNLSSKEKNFISLVAGDP
ncbi:hypothetical protein OIDMADRAFT_178728 [Oidiodendron maius Zn]|uniref:Uncharacterized protein n=1 Tax=Oidiodendron maius (strain Zn) TaxID=913774 RepID=A0A0C3CVC7_OIDMZ|nr:hypothetical protein OIDMADRAFT_178728 [Oidiodendron maius Zn]